MAKSAASASKATVDGKRRSPFRAYVTVTTINLVHVASVFLTFVFGLMRIQIGLFAVRNDVEKYLTANHTRMIMSALPELLIFPPHFLGSGLLYIYCFVLYHECLTKDILLLAKQRRFTRYSLLTSGPHILFCVFVCLDGLIIWLAARAGYARVDASQSLVILIVCSVVNVVWLISSVIFFPYFLKYRRRLVRAENKLIHLAKKNLIEDDHSENSSVRSGTASGQRTKLTRTSCT